MDEIKKDVGEDDPYRNLKEWGERARKKMKPEDWENALNAAESIIENIARIYS